MSHLDDIESPGRKFEKKSLDKKYMQEEKGVKGKQKLKEEKVKQEDDDEMQNVIDEQDKRLLNERMPFFYKYFDFDVDRNFLGLMVWRLFQAIFMTSTIID